MSFASFFAKSLNPLGFDPINNALQKSWNKKDNGSATPLTDLYGANALAKLDETMPSYRKSYNGAGGAAGLQGRTYEQWLRDHMSAHPEDDGRKFLQDYSTNYTPDGNISKTNPEYLAHPELYEEVHADQPIEQTVFEKVRDDYLLPDLEKDKQRQVEADKIIAQNNSIFSKGRDTLASIYGGHFDGAKYLADNPDVAAGVKAGQAAGDTRSIDEMAESHYNQYGKAEGRPSAYVNSRLEDEYAFANKDYQTRLGALDTNDATVRAAVNESQGVFQKDLATELATRQAAIDTEIKALQGAVGTQAESRRAALLTEKKQLLAAQADLGKVRVEGANTQATAANLSAQNARDVAEAEMAAQGYVGGSSFDNARMGQALMAGRMSAAGTLADANTLNAQEVAQILASDATQGYGISTDEAKDTKDVTSKGATDTRGLTEYGATQGRGIDDTAQMSRLTLTQNTAAGKLAAANANADKTQGYFDNDFARRLSAPAASAAMAQTQFGLNNSADTYAQSGLTRGLSNLGWFAAPTTAIPQAQTYQQTPVVDDSIAQLGAAVGNAGLSYYAGQKAATPTTTTATGYKLKPVIGAANPNSGAGQDAAALGG